ncbi:hypothetical protein Tco_1302106 [Tanacetum coccineum]
MSANLAPSPFTTLVRSTVKSRHRQTHPLLKLDMYLLSTTYPSPRHSPTNYYSCFLSPKLLVITLESLDPSGTKNSKALKAQITKLKKQAKPVIKHHKAISEKYLIEAKIPKNSLLKET